MSTISLTEEQYNQYNELRSRLYSILENPKRIGRQLKSLDRALYRADPKARAVAMSEPVFKTTHDTLVRWMPRFERWYHRHPGSFRRIQELVQTIFVVPAYPTSA